MSLYGHASKRKAPTHHTPHVRKGDTVVVLSGKDRGKQGRVLRVNATKSTAIVERVNFSKKHTRAESAGRTSREASWSGSRPIHVAKLQVICSSCSEPTRLGSHRTAEGAVRFCRKCNADLEK